MEVAGLPWDGCDGGVINHWERSRKKSSGRRQRLGAGTSEAIITSAPRKKNLQPQVSEGAADKQWLPPPVWWERGTMQNLGWPVVVGIFPEESLT